MISERCSECNIQKWHLCRFLLTLSRARVSLNVIFLAASQAKDYDSAHPMESLSVEAILGLTGLVILVGLAGELLFHRTGIPGVIFLMGLGVLLGPVLHLADGSTVTHFAPYFGTVALLIILFDGGINLQMMKVLKETPLALLYSVTVFLCTLGTIAALYVWVLQGAWLEGLLLGSILGGTAAAIILPVVSKTESASEPVKVFVSLDSAFSEVFVVVSALALMGAMTSEDHSVGVVRDIFHAFWDALTLAVLAGAAWARFLTWLEGQPLSYMLTLAAIFVLYYFAELLGANGAITILLFGLVLANMEFLVGRLARPIRALIGYELNQAQFALDTFLKRINEELSFLMRTFFYVLLGLILDLSTLSWQIFVVGLGLFGSIAVVRWMITDVMGRTTCGWTVRERLFVAAMLPRGVATAVMAFLPSAAGIPNTEHFPLYALTVITLGVMGMTISLAVYRRWELPTKSKIGSVQLSSS